MKNNNCTKFNGNLEILGLTNLNDDKCLIKENNIQSINPGNYRLSNFYNCDCGIENIQETANDSRLLIKDGFGISKCNVNNDSELRIGKTKKYPRCNNQLFTRPYLTVPFMGRGSGNANIESSIKSSGNESFYTKVNQENLYDKDYYNTDNIFVPLVKNLKNTVQNPNNLIEESADERWLRGGVPTRQIIKDIDYFSRNKDSKDIKQYLKNKKKYMHHCLN